jgi:branched-chain amino acid transport system ATP-binding protein
MTFILEGQHLRKVFGGLVAVSDVSLQVAEGSVHAIIGPNGAGKTTLFNMLSGKYPPTNGQVYFNNEDITALPQHLRAQRGLGRSYQITNIFPNLTVHENVRLGVQANSQVWRNFWRLKESFSDQMQRVEEIIALVQLADDTHTVANALPHGGKRKLELAILLATSPQVLLLDEPTAGMASEQVPELMAIIDNVRVQENKTIVLVEHNMNVVMGVSDKITVMNYGEVIAEGTPDEIAANTTVQSVYLGGLYEDLNDAKGAH